MSWQEIARANGISDPRKLHPGQRLKIPRNAGKIHAHVLDSAHNPLFDVSYQIRSEGKTISGKTSRVGQTVEFWPTAAGQKVEFFVKKLSGEWKLVYETTSHLSDKLVTLVSPRLKLAAETHPHLEGAAPLPQSIGPRPKAAAAGQQTASKFSPDKGIKTEQLINSSGGNALKVTSDDAALDDFLDKYTGDPITEDDYKDAAKELGCKVNAVKAVHATEVGAGSFTVVDGRTVPKILYERHYFYRLSGQKYWDTNPDLSYPVGYYRMNTKYLKKTQKLIKADGTVEDVEVWVRFNSRKDKDRTVDAETGKQLIDEGVLTKERDTYGSLSYKRLRKSFKLDEAAALESCSWGAFQIMGANYKILGYGTVHEMVRELSRSERPHLKGFVSFVKADSTLLRAIQKEDFAKFACHYNGPSYAENNYDATIKRHFDNLEMMDAKKSDRKSK